MKGILKVCMVLLLVMAIALGAVLVLALNGVVAPFGIGDANMELVNRQSFDAAGLSDILVSYSSETIEILPSGDGQVVLEEYMRNWKDENLATVSQNGGSLSIRAGHRGWGIGFLGINSFGCKVKLYLPRQLAASLRVETTSGSIKSDTDLVTGSFEAKTSSGSIKLTALRSSGDIGLSATSGSVKAEALDAAGQVQLAASSGSVKPGRVAAAGISAETTSGSIHFEAAAAETVRAKASSGSVTFEKLEGAFTLSATSGSVKVQGGAGRGTADTSSGSIELHLAGLTGDVALKSTSGGCKLYLPRESALNFYGQTTSGSIKTPDNDSLAFNQKGNQASGSFGAAPQYTVDMQASSGSVRLEWE